MSDALECAHVHHLTSAVPLVVAVITVEWRGAIDGWLRSLVALGRSANTIRTRRDQVEHFARRAGVGPWEVDADRFTDYLAAQEWAQETRRSRLAALRTFYGWAIAKGHISVDPTADIARVKPGKPNPMPVPDAVYLAALVRADADEALWIDLAAEHGLRRGEISVIHSRDIIPTLLGYDILVHGKGDKPRTVPLTNAMADALTARGDGYLFPGDDHGHVSPRWLGVRVSRLLGGMWTIHKLRHRAATRFWVVAHGDPYAVADLMGWANLSMVRVYVKQPDDRLRGIVEAASRTGAPLARV